MLFITPPGHCLVLEKKMESLYALGRKVKRNLLGTKYKRHRENVNVVAAKNWEFIVSFLYSLVGRGSSLKRRSMGQICWRRQFADVFIGLCESGTPLSHSPV